jgi:polyisoprenoid-binding protein YceI
MRISRRTVSGLLTCVVCLFALSTSGQILTIDPNQSSVEFSIKNFGATVEGRLTEVTGNITFNPAAPETITVKLTIPVKQIDTGIGLRDKHLKDKGYFDVGQYPEIRFNSTSVKLQPGRGMIEGVLTIKGKTKTVHLPFEYDQTPGGYKFASAFQIDRRDYGVGGKSLSMSDLVKIKVQISAYSVNKPD